MIKEIRDKIRCFALRLKGGKPHTRSREEALEMIQHSVAKTSAEQRKRKHRAWAVIMSALLVASSFLVIPADVYAQDDFDEFLENEWREMMEDDYTSLHSSVKDYKSMGLSKPDVSFGEITFEEVEEEVRDARETLDELHKYDFDSLDEEAQHDYLALEYWLECIIGMEEHPEFLDFFRPISGSISNIKDFMLDFPLYNKEDLDDYITLLEDYPRYIGQMVDFTRKQAADGYFMDDDTLDEAVMDLNDFAEAGEDNEMIVVFANNLDNLDWLEASDKAEYLEKNKKIVLEKVIPAYEAAAGELEALRGSRKAGKAVCDLDGGPEYYKWLARYKCSSEDSIEEMFDFLTKSIEDVMDYYIGILMANPDLEEPDTITSLDSLDEVISYLESHMTGFPEGPEVSYKLAYLDDSVAESAMAYYMPSPVDDINENVIHVNKDAVDDINTLYFTLAHEGFPGHLYQLTWFQDSGSNILRHELSAMGYEEGWANYVERIMLNRSELDTVSAEYIACDEFVSYMLNAAADLAVNGLGYDIEDLKDWLDDVGMVSDFADSLYDYVVSYPGVLLPYGYGQARMWDLRERAQVALGDDFDEEEYHLAVLTYGSRPFELVEQDVAAYVSSRGGSLPDEAKLFASGIMSNEGGLSADESTDIAANPKFMERMIFTGHAVILCTILLVVSIIMFIIGRRILGDRKK